MSLLFIIIFYYFFFQIFRINSEISYVIATTYNMVNGGKFSTHLNDFCHAEVIDMLFTMTVLLEFIS